MPKKVVYEVDLIRPSYEEVKASDEIACLMCGLNYMLQDYELLLDSRKLMYFDANCLNFWNAEEEDFLDLDEAIVCHECLYKTVLSAAKNKKLNKAKVIIKDRDKTYNCNFYVDKDGGFFGD